MSVPWNTRTQIGSATVGSYNHSGDDYTFRIYATATRSGRNASVVFEYTITLNNGYAGWEGYTSSTPYWTFSSDGTQRDSGSVPTQTSSGTLKTYTQNISADDDGTFALISASAVWHDIGYGWVAKSNTVSGSVQLPSLPTYTVQFNSNGGSGTIANATKYDGIGLVLPSSGFTKTGYHMTAWRKGSTSGTAYALGGTYTDNEATTMYAIWTINTYSVRFNANGGSGSMSNESFTYGETKALTSNAFTRQGYVFKGWATSPSGSVVYTDGESVSNLTGEDGVIVDLYAVWAKGGMRVKYNGEWKDGEVYAKVNGEWKSGQVYAKNNGTWKEGN
jgi:hypothetical protein